LQISPDSSTCHSSAASPASTGSSSPSLIQYYSDAGNL
jgi:hypothetical protein